MNYPNSTFSPEHRLKQYYFSKIIGEARRRYKVPALAVTVMNSEQILLQEIQGVRVVDKPAYATLEDYFHIGSCSKSVLALMAGKLIDQQKIRWQTRFFDIFPELKDDALNVYHNIVLEDLFLCVAGIKAYTHAATEPLPEYDPSIINKRLEFIKHLLKQPPASKTKNCKFKFVYSNASYTMTAAMLEKVTGQAYEVLVKKTLNEDLGLSVHIGWPNSISPDQPWGHMITGKKVASFPPDHEYKLPDLITPAGDLSLTPRDYAKYTQLHLRGLMGKDNYISNETYNHIHFGHHSFSLGVANGKMAGKKYSEFDGSAGTFFCRSIIAPQEDFAFTIMTNATTGTENMKAVDWLTMKIVKKYFGWWWMFWL